MTDLITKYQLDTHVFSAEPEAMTCSMDMGLEGRTHVYDVNGQAYYMPGSSHKEYLEAMGYEGEEDDDDEMEVSEDRMMEALRVVVETILDTKKNYVEGKILKVDDEQRIIYGWASVSTYKGDLIVDKQGDIIEMDTLEKAVNGFMEHVRVGKTMHVGEQTGVIIHSFPVSKQICEALGIQSDTEGWIVGYKVYDDATWEGVKSGKYASFSIGGRAIKEEYLA
jgi:hypothetical protein